MRKFWSVSFGYAIPMCFLFEIDVLPLHKHQLYSKNVKKKGFYNVYMYEIVWVGLQYIFV